MEVIREALRQHDEERKFVKTIRLVGSKASSSSVKEASKRLRIKYDHAHVLTPSFKEVHISKLAECVLTCRAEVQQCMAWHDSMLCLSDRGYYAGI